MNQDEFYRIMNEAIERLPDEFIEALDNVEIEVADYPDAEAAGKHKGTLLGLYTGIPITARGAGYSSGLYAFAQPDRIYLYKKNLESFCKYTGKDLTEQIRETLFHEIGHYMGLSEEEVGKLKYRKTR